MSCVSNMVGGIFNHCKFILKEIHFKNTEDNKYHLWHDYNFLRNKTLCKFHKSYLENPLGNLQNYLLSSYFKTAVKASWGTSTLPNCLIRFFPSFGENERAAQTNICQKIPPSSDNFNDYSSVVGFSAIFSIIIPVRA